MGKKAGNGENVSLGNIKKVLFVASELAPFSKVGGLGDVVGSLPAALRKLGQDVRVLTPSYGSVSGCGGVLDKVKKLYSVKALPTPVVVALGGIPVYCAVYEALIDGVVVWFLECPEFFEENIYPSHLNAQTVSPFVLLSFAALEMYRSVGWKPDVFHCHDWPTAILPIALKWHKYYSAVYPGSKSVFTIHNLAHQGIFPPEDMLARTGIDKSCFSTNAIEYYGNVNLLKGAIIASSHVTTVSPTYAREIQSPLGGANLDGVLRANTAKLSGILNGLDTTYWNPELDKKIPAAYSSSDMRGKAKNRAALVDECCWDDDGRPIVVCVSRLVEQKGFDIILSAMPELAESGARYVFLGSGSPYIEEGLTFAQSVHSQEVRFFRGYHEELSHLLYSGGDIFLMPSLFEPCGLSQLISMLYGTVPVARAVGGLADTIIDVTDGGKNNGFLFNEYSQDGMMWALNRAISLYGDKGAWKKLVMQGMLADFTWEKSALSYIDIYNS